MAEREGREDIVGTIEHTRKMLAFLETLTDPSETVQSLIRQYRAEVAGWDYAERAAKRAEMYADGR